MVATLPAMVLLGLRESSSSICFLRVGLSFCTLCTAFTAASYLSSLSVVRTKFLTSLFSASAEALSS